MERWIVVVEFVAEPDLSEIVRMQAALGEDQISIMNSDCGFAVVVRRVSRPNTSLIERSAVPVKSLFVGKVMQGAIVYGSIAQLDWWTPS